jgi:hypothetical protein
MLPKVIGMLDKLKQQSVRRLFPYWHATREAFAHSNGQKSARPPDTQSIPYHLLSLPLCTALILNPQSHTATYIKCYSDISPIS